MATPRRPSASFSLPYVLAAALASTGCGRAPEAEAGAAGAPQASPLASAAPALPLVEFTGVAERLEASHNSYHGRAQVAELRTQLAQTSKPMKRAALEGELARNLVRLGEVDEAIVLIESAWKTVAGMWGTLEHTPELVEGRRQIQIVRAQTYLRQAEVANCITRHNRECCIFPFEGGGIHTDVEPTKKSLAIYLELAQENPGDLTHRWMANILAMAIGEHPGALPPELVIPDEVFDSELDIGQFRDVAPAVGADVFSISGGSAVDDFDGDGLLDIAVSNFHPRGPLTILMNDGKGGYRDHSRAAGVLDQFGGLNLLTADYDSDGDPDLFVLRGAWLLKDGFIRNSLLRNDGEGNFTDVTYAAGVAEPKSPTQTGAFGDFDGDGWLDLYVGNESVREENLEHRGLPSQLFLNDGDGTFTIAAGEATNERYCKGVAAGDYDGDNDLDLYISNITEKNRLYRNDGSAHFEDVAAELGVEAPDWSFATWFFDYDNDGRLDLYVSGFGAEVPDVAAGYIGVEDHATRPRLYHNEGDGFRDVHVEMGLDRPMLPMGANFGDYDNDGWLDLILATGKPPFDMLMPNLALRNDAGKRFQDITRTSGLGHLQKGHGVTFADLDNDGDQDVHQELGGFYPGDGFANALFENPGHGNHYLALVLAGTHTNRGAVGARIRIVLDTPAGPRELHRAAGCVSSFGGAPGRQEIGLGDARGIELLEITWPRSGEQQRFEEVPLDALVRVVEGAAELEVLELVPAPFRK